MAVSLLHQYNGKTHLHPPLLALAVITVGGFKAVILVHSISVLIKGLVLFHKRKQSQKHSQSFNFTKQS
jgi:hypothetical protein